MFGWGLNDAETMPYQVGLKTNGNYSIYNFGVPAYGPHHMLSEIENGLVKDIVNGKTAYAVYEAIFDHVGRAAGISSAYRNPKYILNAKGEIVYQGRFDEFDTVPLKVKEELRKHTLSDIPHIKTIGINTWSNYVMDVKLLHSNVWSK